jgi:FKBP-type peptidyl-prolyl cis-trans isomerase
MKYTLFILMLTFAVCGNAQNGLQHTPAGASFEIFTHSTGDKIKLNDVITFQFIEKTDKDSVLASSYVSGKEGQTQCIDPKAATDIIETNLMQIFPLLAVNDSVLVKVPTDSIFKGHEEQRPAFFPKGSSLNFVFKIERVQTLDEAMAERNAAMAKMKAEEAADSIKYKTAEDVDIAKYIATHKLIVKTTATGLKYMITKRSIKPKPLAGDTLLVNYTGRTLDDHVFDSSIGSVAKAAGLNQPGRTYEPIQVVVGTGGVIPGWDEGLLLLNEGAKATFIIPFSLAYGAQGEGDIKPYSTLVFDIELVKIKPIKHPVTPKPAAKKPLHKRRPVKNS